ncbi:hypothetical protein [Streptomyces sp. CB03911]|nr:hypothetical protein [Streptomyces sp. CB03911]
MAAPLRIIRIADPIPALELVRPDGRGWLLMPLPRTRPRMPRWAARRLSH